MAIGKTIGLAGFLVGAKGFEPSTPCSQSRCATRLRHAPFDRKNTIRKDYIGLWPGISSRTFRTKRKSLTGLPVISVRVIIDTL